MSGYVLHLPKEESVVLTGQAVQRLIGSGNGDAALLYLAMVQSHTGDEAALEKLLGWRQDRLQAAGGALVSLDLVSRGEAAAAAAVPEEPHRGDRRPEYTRADTVRALEGAEFSQLTHAVEEKLCKRLTTPDLAMLLGLYDNLGMPSDVIFLLVSFCVERSARQYGQGRLPTMRQIEKEGYAWARMELMTMERADAYIQKYQNARQAIPKIMALLRLGDRAPSPTEERYMLSWNEAGFDPEVIEKAYDKTILKCKELKWSYLNRILESWKQKGFKTLEDVELGEGRRKAAPRTNSVRSDVDMMDAYLAELRRQREKEGK